MIREAGSTGRSWASVKAIDTPGAEKPCDQIRTSGRQINKIRGAEISSLNLH